MRHLSPQQEAALIYERTAACLFGIFVCSIVIPVLLCAKAYKLFIYRLTIYLTFISLLALTISFLSVLPVALTVHNITLYEQSDTLKEMCAITGYLDIYINWVDILFVSWITLHLFLLAVFRIQMSTYGSAYEITGVLFSFLLPLTFTWVPFLNDMYGKAGPWCSLRATVQKNSNDSDVFIVNQVVNRTLQLLPIGLDVLAVSVIVGVLCKRAMLGSYTVQNSYRRALKEALPLLIYPTAVLIVRTLNFTNHLLHAYREIVIFSMWVIEAVVSPLTILLIPVILLLIPRKKRLKWCLVLKKKRENMQESSSLEFFTPTLITTERTPLAH